MTPVFKKLERYFGPKYHLSVLNLNKGRWIVGPDSSNIPYLKAENANGGHILMQPIPEMQPYYLLIDDIDWSLVYSQHQDIWGRYKPGRMVVETSKNNYQVWIRSSRPLFLEEKRYWLKKLHSDPGADPNNRWGRCPGFRNRKEKHRDAEGGYPLARLIWVDWKYPAEIPQRDYSVQKSAKKHFSPQPLEGDVCHHKDIVRSDYENGNESATDFSYALALFRQGYSSDVVRQKILTERQNWENHNGERRIQDYLDRTIRKAKSIVDKS